MKTIIWYNNIWNHVLIINIFNMAYFYNILYNINVYNEVIIVFIYIQFNNNNCASVFHTQYYHGAQFHLKYNHDLHPKMQINCLCTTWRACFLLHIRLGVSETYFISDTSRHGCKMLQFVIMKLCLVPFFSIPLFLLLPY